MKKIIIYYFLFLFFLLSMFCSGVVDSQDGLQYLAVARNIYYKGKPISPPYEFDTRQNIHMPSVIGRDGESYSFTGLGFSLALVPAVAITDIFYKVYNISSPVHFPLENDWLILLIASFTNAFFGALLGTILLLYFIQLKIPIKQSLFLSLISIFSTNLFVYTKHMLAHMMFTSFLVLSFYLLKKYSDTINQKFLIFSAMSFGVMMITYNSTFLLIVPSYIFYYLLLTKPKYKIYSLRKILKDIVFFIIGLLPLLLIYLWFENLRSFSGSSLGFASPVFLEEYAQNRLIKVPVTVFFEGVYGELFSPGRSFFLYSPILLLIMLFWFKIKSQIRAELLIFLSISATYILFYGAQYSIGSIDQGIASNWHGESSWGPRYLTPLIPFGMLIVGVIYTKLKNIHKILVFLPLILIGLYIEILGVLMPYQIKYHNLETGKIIVNSTEYTKYSYINIFPRYSPLLSMSKSLIKLTHSFPLTFNHGIYNVRLFDGIDFPFNVGPERWRIIENSGYINFDNLKLDSVNNIQFGLINHVMGESSSTAKLSFSVNKKSISEKPIVLEPRERRILNISVPIEYLISKNNLLEIAVKYDNPKVDLEKTQILGIISMSINHQPVNLESIDFPYVSKLGPVMTDKDYLNYGGTNKDLWRQWEIHTQMFERIPDFWWIRNLLYWDIPKEFIVTLASVSFMLIILFFRLLTKELKK